MFSIALALAATSVVEQMAPAKQGLLQCQMPDALFKTCRSLTKVTQSGPLTYALHTEMLVSPETGVVASLDNDVFVRGNSICQVQSRSEILGAKFTVNGHPLPASKQAQIRTMMLQRLAALQGRAICTTIVTGEAGLTVQGTIDGKRLPAADYSMKWVSPNSDWKVAP